MMKNFLKEEVAKEFAKELMANPIKFKDVEVYGQVTWHWNWGEFGTIENMEYGPIYTVKYKETTWIDRLKMVVAA